jgi:predicted metal-binding membrane protein
MNSTLISREKPLLAACAVLFAASSAGTIYLCQSMSGGMAMPGGWTMSMAWMSMPGQKWFTAAAMFLGMWTAMMVAMMLPSLIPTLFHYNRFLREAGTVHSGALTTLAGASYFLVWTVVGVAAYALGVIATKAEMRSGALAQFVPVATGAVVLLAGCFQLTSWKSRRLARCRDVAVCSLQIRPSRGSACQQGIQWGIDCGLCCLGFMAALLVTGVMNLVTMAILATGVAAERAVPNPQHIARIAGILLIVIGTFMMARTLAYRRAHPQYFSCWSLMYVSVMPAM